jgi:hypothetical protein
MAAMLGSLVGPTANANETLSILANQGKSVKPACTPDSVRQGFLSSTLA